MGSRPAASTWRLPSTASPTSCGWAPAVVARHVAGAVQALRPGGALVVLNLSYQGDTAADVATAHGWATAHGLALEVAGEQPFALWDGRAFVLRRPG